MVGIVFFQPVLQVSAMAGIEIIDGFRVDDIKVKHSNNKKGSDEKPNPKLNVGDNGFEPLTLCL